MKSTFITNEEIANAALNAAQKENWDSPSVDVANIIIKKLKVTNITPLRAAQNMGYAMAFALGMEYAINLIKSNV